MHFSIVLAGETKHTSLEYFTENTTTNHKTLNSLLIASVSSSIFAVLLRFGSYWGPELFKKDRHSSVFWPAILDGRTASASYHIDQPIKTLDSIVWHCVMVYIRGFLGQARLLFLPQFYKQCYLPWWCITTNMSSMLLLFIFEVYFFIFEKIKICLWFDHLIAIISVNPILILKYFFYWKRDINFFSSFDLCFRTLCFWINSSFQLEKIFTLKSFCNGLLVFVVKP